LRRGALYKLTVGAVSHMESVVGAIVCVFWPPLEPFWKRFP